MGLNKQRRQKWAAALLALFALACVLLHWLQSMDVRDLKSSIRTLSLGTSPVLAATTSLAAPSHSLEAADDTSEHERAEIERLTNLVHQIDSELAGLEEMARENEQLRAELARPQLAGLTTEEAQDLEKARAKALSIQCINNLKQFGLSVRTWALDNEDRLPPDIVCMSNELSSPKVLICPADAAHRAATDWSTFTVANCSYEYLAKSATEEEPRRVLSRCSLHGHVGLCDGSVQSSVAKNHPDYFILRNGKLYLEIAPVSTVPVQPNENP